MDIQTFRNYYDTYYEQLCCFLNFYTQDVAVIEDVIQEVFLKLWENKDCLEITYIKTYLFRAAKNRVLNHLRDEENRHQLLENWFNQQQEEKKYKDCFDVEALAKLVNQAVEQLPDRCREIFYLSRKEELSYKQIAERLGISVKTVETQISIALKRIREILSTSAFAFLWLFIR